MSANDEQDERNDQADKAKQHLIQGLGLLFRAGAEAASGLKKEIDKSNVGKSLDDAGRELWRAANNVVSRIGTEILVAGPKDKDKPADPKDKPDDKDPPRWAPGEKPKGPTKEDPGFRIAGDDDEPR
jgi:hypothetical protein